IRASEQDLAEHAARLEAIAKAAGAPALWTQLTQQ
ncbi:DNA polymerase III subunit epsilon, partial [Pseudomonas sp. NPDC078863]